MTTKTKLPALALAAAAVRKTICAAIAILASRRRRVRTPLGIGRRTARH